MCGISGFTRQQLEGTAREILGRMNSTLCHRGPDDAGEYLDEGVCLGHRRLSIIDLEHGKQPMANEDSTVWIVCNGEIYNFRSIGDELSRRGHVFRTRSDTEVILHAYEEEGEECLSRLNGMFAFVLWDSKKRRLFGARDRMGKKPLHYCMAGSQFIFSSELKGILAHPAVGRQIDHVSLAKYLAYEYVPTPRTIFQNIRKLPAGSYFTLDLDGPSSGSPRLQLGSYWDSSFEPPEVRFRNSQEEETFYIQGLQERLSAAVQRRMVSDVPVGVLLSGGIDSSSVAAFMCQAVPSSQVQAFTVAFADKSYDELGYAVLVARHLGVQHFHQTFEPGVMLGILPEVIEKMDEPFADASIIPTYLLSRFARERVKVALGGDGGDELFAGYPTFLADRFSGAFNLLPRWGKWSLQAMASRLPVSDDNISLDFKAKQFLKGASYAPGPRHSIWLGSFSPGELGQLLVDCSYERVAAETVFDEVDAYLKALRTACPQDRVLYLYYKLYLQDDILIKVDRASMAASLEVRSPFLDVDVLTFANSIPFRLKLKGMTSKYVLKRAVADLLPGSVVRRPKKGFGIPLARWLKEDLREVMLHYLDPARIRNQGIFSPHYVQRLVREHLDGKENNRKKLWTLLVFQMWYDQQQIGTSVGDAARAGTAAPAGRAT